MNKVVMIRHGESVWNREIRFTGWSVVRRAELGIQEAIEGGRALRQYG